MFTKIQSVSFGKTTDCYTRTLVQHGSDIINIYAKIKLKTLND